MGERKYSHFEECLELVVAENVYPLPDQIKKLGSFSFPHHTDQHGFPDDILDELVRIFREFSVTGGDKVDNVVIQEANLCIIQSGQDAVISHYKIIYEHLQFGRPAMRLLSGEEFNTAFGLRLLVIDQFIHLVKKSIRVFGVGKQARFFIVFYLAQRGHYIIDIHDFGTWDFCVQFDDFLSCILHGSLHLVNPEFGRSKLGII